MLLGYGWENEPLRFQATYSPHQVTDLEREPATNQPVHARPLAPMRAR